MKTRQVIIKQLIKTIKRHEIIDVLATFYSVSENLMNLNITKLTWTLCNKKHTKPTALIL